MKQTSLIRLLKSFSKQELREFDKFLRSPYFTEGKNIRSRILIEYYRMLKPYHPSFSSMSVSKHLLFSRLYPGKNYNDNIMRKLNSDLLMLAEKFLAQKTFETNRIQVSKYLLEQLKDRQLDKLFDVNFRETEELLAVQSRDDNYFYDKYYLTNLWLDLYGYRKSLYRLDDSFENKNNFFHYLLLGSLRIYIWTLTHSKIINRKPDLKLSDEILTHLSKNLKLYEHIPQIPVHYNLVQLLSTGEEKYYSALRKLKDRYINSLNLLDRNNLYICMGDYCVGMIENGRADYRLERFRLDNEYLPSEALKSLPNIHPFYFLRVAKNALKLKRFGWVRDFISAYSERIEPQSRSFALNYIEAEICFSKKQFGKALEHLSKINTPYSTQKQYVRNLMLQIYCETASYESALSIIESSKHFLARDKHIPEFSRQSHINFIRFAGKLINAASDGTDPGYLEREIRECKAVQNKDWLLEKARET